MTDLARRVHLEGRGTVRVWDCPGPEGSPTLVLLHGVGLTAELNWAAVVPSLARHFRVVAPDLRGHGDGVPTAGGWTLEDAADDVAALAQALGLDGVVAVGYSMGGSVAQVLYQRHPDLVRGLVLCSTSRNIRGTAAEQLVSLGLPGLRDVVRCNPLAQLWIAEAVREVLLQGVRGPRERRWITAQLRRTPLSTVLAATQAVYGFSSHTWIGTVDVPTAVVVTTRDEVVPASRQRKLAAAVPGAAVIEVDAGHAAFLEAPAAFARGLLQACLAVAGARSRADVVTCPCPR